MIAYDCRAYYDPQTEKIYDPEWDEAEAADEMPQYYWCEMFSGGRCIRLYKPSVAKLYSKRTGMKIYPVGEGEKE